MKYIFIGILITISLLGCAQYPENPSSMENQVIIEFSVAGRFITSDSMDSNSKRYYFIAIDCDNVSDTYPLPIIAPVDNYGWGNGWGTSDKASESKGITSYIKYDANNDPPNFYNIVPGSKLLASSAPLIPVSSEIINNGKTMRIILNYSQIATASVLKDQIENLQFNFITTNQLPVDPNSMAPGRKWDALGYKTEKEYVEVNAKKTYTYTGSDDTGDVSDTNLDITDWKIEINYNYPY